MVDTDVVSVSAPIKKDPQLGLANWVARNNGRLFPSAVTIAEIETGIAKARRLGAASEADRLSKRLEWVVDLYRVRVLPMDVPVARALGRLCDQADATGQMPGWPDLAIAATAISRGYVVLTRNVRRFGKIAVPVHNPFEGLPAG